MEKKPASRPPGGHLKIDLWRKNQVLPERNSILGEMTIINLEKRKV